MSTNDTAITTTATAIERLQRGLAKASLDDLVKARTRRSLLLIDRSGSMVHTVSSGERRIDALRRIVSELQATHRVPVVAFGGSKGLDVVEVVPEPAGSTPLAEAIAFGREQGATHMVVVTDGEPNSESKAFEEARLFGGPIDVFFVGDPDDTGARFAKELARRTGGTSGVADLGTGTKQLTSAIAGLLGDGSL
jgi:Mg-chelatase subunit ChlD